MIWAIVSISSGELLYFWPIWMFIPLIFGVIGQMTGRDARIATRVIAWLRLADW